jgi:hypothetical protein
MNYNILMGKFLKFSKTLDKRIKEILLSWTEVLFIQPQEDKKMVN